MHQYLALLNTINTITNLKFRLTAPLRVSAIFLSSLLLTNCASTSVTQPPVEERPTVSSSRTQTTEADRPSRETDLATPLLDENNINIERAEYYQELANNQTLANDQTDSSLSSAEYYVQANDYYQAEQAISNLRPTQLNPTQYNRYSIIQAYIDYSLGNFNQALQRLTILTQRDSTTVSLSDNAIDPTHSAIDNSLVENQTQRVDALLLSSFCYQQLNNYDAAISNLIYRESLLVGSARSETARYTWQIINNLSTEARLSIIQQTNDVHVRNRLEQSLDGQFAVQTDLPTQFDQWRQAGDLHNKQVVDSSWGATSPKRIAVLLPLTSRFSKAAHAVMDGIEYQHNGNSSSYRPILEFYDIGSDPYQAGQYYSAIAQKGYDLIIGPLGKDFANQLYSSVMTQGYGTQTMLLGGDINLNNQNNRVFSRLTMSPEADGVEVANHAQRQGHVTAALLVPDNEQGQRVSQAFTQRWLGQGGNISKTVTYSPLQYDHTVELKQLFDINQSEYRYTRISNTLGFKPEFSAYRRADLDFIFMVADNESGRIVRPQINFFNDKTLPIYATSSIFNGIQDDVNNLDLEQTEFPIMPWVLQSTDIAPYAGQLNMLFAMGSDAYQIAANYQVMRGDPNVAISGNMGSLHMESSGEIIFQPVWAKFTNGLAQANVALPEILNSQQFPNNNQSTDSGLNSYNDSNWDTRQSSRKTGTSVPQ